MAAPVNPGQHIPTASPQKSMGLGPKRGLSPQQKFLQSKGMTLPQWHTFTAQRAARNAAAASAAANPYGYDPGANLNPASIARQARAEANAAVAGGIAKLPTNAAVSLPFQQQQQRTNTDILGFTNALIDHLRGQQVQAAADSAQNLASVQAQLAQANQAQAANAAATGQIGGVPGQTGMAQANPVAAQGQREQGFLAQTMANQPLIGQYYARSANAAINQKMADALANLETTRQGIRGQYPGLYQTGITNLQGLAQKAAGLRAQYLLGSGRTAEAATAAAARATYEAGQLALGKKKTQAEIQHWARSDANARARVTATAAKAAATQTADQQKATNAALKEMYRQLGSALKPGGGKSGTAVIEYTTPASATGPGKTVRASVTVPGTWQQGQPLPNVIAARYPGAKVIAASGGASGGRLTRAQAVNFGLNILTQMGVDPVLARQYAAQYVTPFYATAPKKKAPPVRVGPHNTIGQAP